jgi:UDP-N-acetylglucosamine:LPS N-acetylglucosamine transferase
MLRDKLRLLLVSSSGGHLSQLHALEPWWGQHERLWVTFPKDDARTLLDGERVIAAHHPTTRNIPNAFRNFRLARDVFDDYRPDVVVSTGAGVAVPFFLAARHFGARTVYVEVYDRIDSPTMTGRMCYPLADLFLLQWAEQQRFYPRGKVIGPLL